jgi:hypothetical protein
MPMILRLLFLHHFYEHSLKLHELKSEGGEDDGRCVPLAVAWFLRAVRRCGVGLRTFAEAMMTWLYVLCGGIALLITVYLVIALLFPEKF